jgi:GAF domain/Histidine kinase-, DNA gyrase B-, and HSP90-like ATPase
MIRFELDGTATLVANEGTTAPHVRVGRRWEGFPATGLTATVLRTGRAARVDDYRDIPGGQPYLAEGLRSAVAVPVHVHGRLWGMIAVGSGEGPLPPDTEQRCALGRRSVVPVELDVRVDGRLSESVEVGVYYVVSEMLANAEKHVRASVVEVSAEAADGMLRVRVRDDGIGGADPARGSGLLGLKDRIEALGGTFSVHSPAGRGTTVTCEVPVTAGSEYPG